MDYKGRSTHCLGGGAVQDSAHLLTRLSWAEGPAGSVLSDKQHKRAPSSEEETQFRRHSRTVTHLSFSHFLILFPREKAQMSDFLDQTKVQEMHESHPRNETKSVHSGFKGS